VNNKHRYSISLSLFFAIVMTTACLQADESDSKKKAEPSRPAYQLATPKGWKTERISLPPSFAPNMTWQGHEDIRFAPGMFKRDQADFFTYFVLFWVEGKPDFSEKQLTKELIAYYQGLSQAVIKTRSPGTKVEKVTATFEPADPKADKKKWRRAELKWTEPFTTVASQKLRLQLKTGVVGERSYVIMLVSPSKEKSVWKPLKELADGLKFSK
jgi:hypothetical protein